MGFSILARNGLCSMFWFRLGFRCLSPFLSLLSFLRKGVLFHHDVLVPFGSGSGSGACLPFFSLSFLRQGVLFHHDVLVPLGSGSGSGACLPSSLFFPFSGNGVCSIMVLVPPGSGWGSGACLPSAFFSLFSGVISLFFLVPAGVPVLVSLLLSFFFSLRKGFCSIMMSWFLLVPARVQVLVFLLLSFFFSPEWHSVPPLFPGSWWFRLGFRCLSPFLSLLSFLRKGVLFHHDVLVAPGSGSGSGACLPSSLFFLFQERGSVHHDVLVPLGSGSGSGACLPSSLFFLFFGKGSVPS